MRTVNITRTISLRQDAELEREARLVASGAMKMPQKEMDWERFFRVRAGNVSTKVAGQAAIDSRGDR